MKRFVYIIIMGCLMLSWGASASEDEAKARAGSLAAQQWLEMIDSGNYKQAWSSAHGFLQGTVPEDKWVKNRTKARNQLGAVIERTLTSSKFVTKLPYPGAPEGEYVISTFETTFKKKGRMIVTVIVAKTDDGIWKVTSSGITPR